MTNLEKLILEKGVIKEGGIVKVDSFINHQIDVNSMMSFGKELADFFKNSKIDKVLTAEVSGIAIGMATAAALGVPMVFAKKSQSKTLDSNFYEAEVESFTHKSTYKYLVSKDFLNYGENILVVDDFLAKGYALLGLSDIILQAGSNLCGIGILIEKTYLNGKKPFVDKNIPFISLAKIQSIDKTIAFEN